MRQPSGAMFIALGRAQILLQGLGGYTIGCADAPPRRKLHTYSRVVTLCTSLYPRSSSPWRRKGTLLLNANKDYKGLPARGRRKIQTHCHLRGNFPCLGEERVTKKGTEPLADAMTRLLGMRGADPRPHGSSGCPPRKLSSSISSTKDHAGGRAGGQHPPHRLPESNLVAGGDDAKNSRQTWH